MENSLIDGRYLLLGAIGAGGEARVFRAQNQETGSEVALRLALNRATQHALLELPAFHEGWVQLLAFGMDPQYGAYQVFELLAGGTLRQAIQAGPFDEAAWCEFVNQSLPAVEALHDAGWPHGDINADNFFRTAAGWKLLELPFLLFDPPAGRSAVFGSIHTLAPEQIDGAPPSVEADIYSLGCLYYYAASGSYPHPGASSVEVAIHSLRFPADPLAEKAPGLPSVWSDWVMQLVARQPRDRPASLAAARQLLGVA
jgi:serine/threonine-protein kinase